MPETFLYPAYPIRYLARRSDLSFLADTKVRLGSLLLFALIVLSVGLTYIKPIIADRLPSPFFGEHLADIL